MIMVGRIYFRYFACKNYNKRAAVLAASIPVTEAFLFNIFLAVFVFSIANAGTRATGILSRS